LAKTTDDLFAQNVVIQKLLNKILKELGNEPEETVVDS
jgi:hypothetical protein